MENKVLRPVVLNVEQCAELLGRSPCAIYQKVYKKEIPFHKPDGRVIFLYDEILEWIRTPPKSRKPEPSLSKFQSVRRRLDGSLKTEETPKLSKFNKLNER